MSASARRSMGNATCESARTAPWPGKVLRDRRHAGFAHAREVGGRQGRHRVGVAVERAVADDLAQAVIEVHAGREAEIDPDRPQLGGEEPADRVGAAQPLLPILIESPADEARRRQRGKALAKALHPPALMIGGDQQMRRADRADRRAKR